VFTTKLLFVCSGNTCRSPMAEYYAKYLFAMLGRPWTAASVGISALRGMPMSEGAKNALVERGYAELTDVVGHMSAPADEDSLTVAERIYGMTPYHAEILKKEFPRHAERVFVMPEPAADPWGGDQKEYLRCLDVIARGVDEIVGKWS